jgi:hypothetical protein
MPGATIHDIGAVTTETVVEVAWAQWTALTPAAVPATPRQVSSIIDPEALVLISLAVSDHERRLDDLLAGWARIGSWLLSIQRLKTLAREYPESVRARLPVFARYAADAGDRRWRPHASSPADTDRLCRREKEPGPVRLAGGPALMLRLRAGIGVGTKADLLTVLLGLHGAAANLRTLALATGYSNRAMRTAAEEMARARFIHEIEGPPAAYRAEPGAWCALLGGGPADASVGAGSGVPPWRFWSIAFAFLTAVIEWEREAHRAGWSPYVVSSRARDLVEAYRGRLQHLDVTLATSADARGEAYLDAFRDLVHRVCSWAYRALET